MARKETGQLRIKEHTGCLGYIGDYTTQFFRDCNKPLKGSLLDNQYSWLSWVLGSGSGR